MLFLFIFSLCVCVHVFPLTYKKCHKPNRIDEKHKQTNDTVFFLEKNEKKKSRRKNWSKF